MNKATFFNTYRQSKSFLRTDLNKSNMTMNLLAKNKIYVGDFNALVTKEML